MKKEEILQKINDSTKKPAEGRNSMGCSESYYNEFYSVGQCFTKKELEAMDIKALKNLLKLAKLLSDVFY